MVCETQMTFAEMIARRLKELGIEDATEAAQRCDLNYITFYFIAEGKRQPSVAIATRICLGLDIPLDVLRDLDDVRKPPKQSRYKGKGKR